MYNYYQQQPSSTSPINPRPNMLPPQPFGGLRGHPVSSLEEVKASSIDFDGSIFYFPDIANKRIYTKTVGMDGVALLNMYELKPLPATPIEGDYITRTEFDQALARISELFPALFTGNSFTLGCCDNNTHMIYIADGLDESKFYKVLGHEMTHAAMFSYRVSLTYDQEELLADIISTYGKEIVIVTNRVFRKMKK